MTQLIARMKARKYSDHYNTHWFVRYMPNGTYETYAHSSDDQRTVAVFYCGKEIK